MEKKRCLFCDGIVHVKPKGDYDWFVGCLCSPEGSYGLRRDSYEPFNSLSYAEKRNTFPIISAYIRELTDCEETVELSIEDIEAIDRSPRKPLTLEAKGGRLLQYLHRHSNGPDEPVPLHKLGDNYNLTYSPNLQEFVYIIEKLREEQLIERTGSTLSLTEKGWKEAAAKAAGRPLKPCFVLLSSDEELRREWSEKVLPRIEQCGFLPRMAEHTVKEKPGDQTVRLISGSKLLIADLTDEAPEVYFAAGFALGINVPVIWTKKRGEADRLRVQSDQIRPLEWEDPDDLAAILQQRLTV